MTETREVTTPIKKALEQCGYLVFRMNSGRVKVRGGWIHLCDEGTADLLAFHWNKPVLWLETKSLDGNTSKSRHKAQQAFRDRVVDLGHQYIVAKSLQDVLSVL